MTDKNDLYKILKAYEDLQNHISAFPDRSERPEMTDEEYDALSDEYDEVIKNMERHVFELLDSALRRAEEEPDFLEV